MGTTEKNVYKPCKPTTSSIPDDIEKNTGFEKAYPVHEESTVCEKNVWIESDIVGLRSAIKKFGVDRFKTNCVKASDGLLWAIKKEQLNRPKPASAAQPTSSAVSSPVSSCQCRPLPAPTRPADSGATLSVCYSISQLWLHSGSASYGVKTD